MVLQKRFFAGLRVDVGLVIGFFAEVGFFADDFAASRDLLFAILSSPSCIWVAHKIDSRIECQAPIHFFLALSTIVSFKYALVPLYGAC